MILAPISLVYLRVFASHLAFYPRMISITRVCLVISTILFVCPVANGQYKVFEKYRQYMLDQTTTDDNKNESIIDLDSMDEKDTPESPSEKANAKIIQSAKRGDRKLAYDNYHRNQITGLDPKHPLLPPADTTLTTGLFHTCAITKRTGVDKDTCGDKECGPVKCWGHNDSGQSSPPPGAMFTQVSAGGYFTCGIRVEGDLVCWGQIDQTDASKKKSKRSPPKQPVDLDEKPKRRLDKSEYKDEIARRKKIAKEERTNTAVISRKIKGQHIQVSSGMKHACAIGKDLAVRCWGRDDYGEASPPSGEFVQVRIPRIKLHCNIII